MKKLIEPIMALALFAFAASCTSNPELEKALRAAGGNRPEMEKVLEHYSANEADSLRLRAAEFLIANMPGHYTLATDEIEWLRERYDTNPTYRYFFRKSLDVISPFFIRNEQMRMQEDITHISSDYLIDQIDAAFDRFERYSWLEDMPFDLFAEYLLPYRFTHERPDYWRDSLMLDDGQLEMISNSDVVKYTPSQIAVFSLPEMHVYDKAFVDATFGKGNDLFDCYSQCMRDLIRCRAMGIPSTIDFIPFYANRNGSHYWLTHMVPEEKVARTTYTGERKAPKIYRFTYARNNVYESAEDEYIPELFRDPFLRDVTDMYINTRDVSVNDVRRSGPRGRFAYLCVFNDLEWRPVAIGERSRGSVDFDDMGESVVYLPAVYEGERLAAINYPLIVRSDGEIEYLVPDTAYLQKIHLTRKYPASLHVSDLVAQVDSSRWTASNALDFVDADTLFIYRASGNTIESDHDSDPAGYRYWRFTPARLPAMLAEFMFFDRNGERLNVEADEIAGPLFDGDPLTNTTLHESITVDMGAETAVSKIICIPRTDGNGIVPGDYYELLYFDLDGWKSLGVVEAEDCSLEYDNVPAGALLWLRNLNSGVEERVFTYEDGEVRFW